MERSGIVDSQLSRLLTFKRERRKGTASRHAIARSALQAEQIDSTNASSAAASRIATLLVSTNELVDAQRAVRAAAQAGEGAEIVDRETGQVIERHAPRRRARSGSPD